MSTRFAFLLLVLSSTTACGVRELPAPASPLLSIPAITEVTETAPPPGRGRLLIASEGEPAKVARVTETVDLAPPMRPYTLLNARKTELLCIAPCAVDLPTGAQALVFTSLTDPERTSTAEVAVPQGTTVVRHAMGRDKPYSGAYVAGIGAVTGGTMLTLAGGFVLGTGLSLDENARNRDGVVVAGAAIGAIGLAALATGIVLMMKNQPERGPGATTTFRVP